MTRNIADAQHLKQMASMQSDFKKNMQTDVTIRVNVGYYNDTTMLERRIPDCNIIIDLYIIHTITYTYIHLLHIIYIYITF